jgi:hypothetical protein
VDECAKRRPCTGGDGYGCAGSYEYICCGEYYGEQHAADGGAYQPTNGAVFIEGDVIVLTGTANERGRNESGGEVPFRDEPAGTVHEWAVQLQLEHMS